MTEPPDVECGRKPEPALVDLQARLNRVVGVLSHLEWSEDSHWCPECGQKEQHAADCEVQLILAKEAAGYRPSKAYERIARFWEDRYNEARAELHDLKTEMAMSGMDVPEPERCPACDSVAIDYRVTSPPTYIQECCNHHSWVVQTKPNSTAASGAGQESPVHVDYQPEPELGSDIE